MQTIAIGGQTTITIGITYESPWATKYQQDFDWNNKVLYDTYFMNNLT